MMQLDHHDDHHHPAAVDRDYPNQGNLQEMQGKIGGKVQIKYKQPYVMDNLFIYQARGV